MNCTNCGAEIGIVDHVHTGLCSTCSDWTRKHRELWLQFVKVLNHAEILELELAGLRSATFKVTTQATLDHVIEK